MGSKLQRVNPEPETGQEPLKPARLGVKEEKFCLQFVITDDRHLSYERAGYLATKPTVQSAAISRMLKQPKIRDRIEELRTEMLLAQGVTKERVTANLAEIAFNKKVAKADRNTALKTLARSLGMLSDTVNLGISAEMRQELNEADRRTNQTLAAICLGMKELENGDTEPKTPLLPDAQQYETEVKTRQLYHTMKEKQMYRDKNKQKEANRKAQAKFKAKGITKVLPEQGITRQGITSTITVPPTPRALTVEDMLAVTTVSKGTMTPEGIKPEVPANYGQPDCQCQQCQRLRRCPGSLVTYNHGAYKTSAQLGQWELNRVSLPGDVDYQAQPAVPKACNTFSDLSWDVQSAIDAHTRWCARKGQPDDRPERIQRAIHYQQTVRAG